MPETADKNADETYIIEVEYDNANDAGQKVCAVLQARLPGDAYQSEI